MGKDERCAGRLIGSPGTPHQNVQSLLGCMKLLSLRLAGGGGNGIGGECANSQLRRFFKKVSTGRRIPPPAIGKTLHEARADYNEIPMNKSTGESSACSQNPMTRLDRRHMRRKAGGAWLTVLGTPKFTTPYFPQPSHFSRLTLFPTEPTA